MLKKKTNKPLYMKKSKAAKQRELEEQEEQDYVDNYFTPRLNTINTPDKEKQYRPYRKGRKRYRETEYTEYEDKVDDIQYYDDSRERGKYHMGTKMNEYTVDDRRHKQRRPRAEYYESEFECSGSDCSECKTCDQRLRSDTELWDYTNYVRQRHRPRESRERGSPYGRHQSPYRQHESPYGSNQYPYQYQYPYGRRVQNYYDVYRANQPIGHQAFRADDTRSVGGNSATEFSNEETEDITEYDHDEKGNYNTDSFTKNGDNKSESQDSRFYRKFKGKPGATQGNNGHDQEMTYDNRGNVHQYQVYATHADDKTTNVFNQPRKTSYDKKKGLPMLGLLDSPVSQRTTGSESIYLPVVVMENIVKLPDNRIMSPKDLVNIVGEAEKPETNVQQVFAATNLIQGNIFQQTQQDNEVANLSHTQDTINLFTVTQESVHPLQKKKSGRSLLSAKKTQSDHSTLTNKFPVTKPYIKVATSKPQTLGSGSNHSLIGSTGKGRIKGSGFFSKLQKKDRQLREIMKQKKNQSTNENLSDIAAFSPETIISIINPNEPRNERETVQIKPQEDTTGIAIKISNRVDQNTNMENEAHDIKQSISKTKVSNVVNKYNMGGRKSDAGKVSTQNQQQTLHAKGKQSYSNSRVQCLEGKKPDEMVRKTSSLAALRTGKMVTKEKVDQNQENPQSPIKNTKSQEPLCNTAKKKYSKPSIFGRKKASNFVTKNTSKSNTSIHNSNLESNVAVKRLQNLERIVSKEKTIVRKTATISGEQQTSYLVYLYQILRIFMGLNMHDTMLNVPNNLE